MHRDAQRQRFHVHQSRAHALEVTFAYKHGLALGDAEHASIQPGRILLSERSLYSTYIFSRQLKKMGASGQFQFNFLSDQMEESMAL